MVERFETAIRWEVSVHGGAQRRTGVAGPGGGSGPDLPLTHIDLHGTTSHTL